MAGAGTLRLAVINQAAGGGATAAARDVLEWGPGRGFEVRYFPGDDAGDAAALLAGIERFRPDLVHFHCWYQSYPYPLLRDLGARYPAVFTAHDVAVVNQYGAECWECFRNSWCFGCPALGPLRRYRPNHRMAERLRKRRVNRSTRCHLVFPSRWMRQRFARSEWRRLPSQVIPIGVDLERFAPAPEDRRALGLPAGPLILFAGSMYGPADHRKGLPDLFAAFAAVRRLLPDAALAVAGRVEGLAEVPPGTVILGEVERERLAAFYRAADLFCLPSLGENFPVTVVEAMAAGLPVVATRVGGIPEQVKEGETGRLVRSGDPAALAAALAALLADRPLREQLGRAARARAVRLFGRNLAAERHEALYRRITTPGAGG